MRHLLTNLKFIVLPACLLLTACGGLEDLGVGGGGGTVTPTASAPTPTPTPAPGQRVFVTSQRYPANLRDAGLGANGLDGADNICQTLADASALGGRWTAWISTSTVDAISRISGNGPWYDMNGTLVFNNKANLGTVPQIGIRFDERGDEPDPFYESWTGTALGGGHKPLSGTLTSTTCQDWTSTAEPPGVRGSCGMLQDATAAWTDSNPLGYCSPFSRHLYCFED